MPIARNNGFIRTLFHGSLLTVLAASKESATNSGDVYVCKAGVPSSSIKNPSLREGPNFIELLTHGLAQKVA